MKRFVFIALMSALSLAALGSMGSVGAQGNGITGDWNIQATGDNFFTGNLHLTQVNDTVVGNATAPEAMGGGILQIDGKLTGQQLSANWRSAKGETGWLTLNFNADMTSFSGEWGYHGRKPNGQLVAQKTGSTDF